MDNQRLEELKERFKEESVKRVAGEESNKFTDFHVSQEHYWMAMMREYRAICIELFDLLGEKVDN